MTERSRPDFPKEMAKKLWGEKMAGKVEADLRRYHPKVGNVVAGGIRSFEDPLIDLKARMMVQVACLSCLAKPQVRMYMLAALNNGVTEEQLWEILRLIGLFSGEPNAVNSSVILCEVLDGWHQRRG